MGASRKPTKSDECPYCSEMLAPDLLHICPAGCCFVEGYEGEQRVICPYCELPFEISAGHACLELIAMHKKGTAESIAKSIHVHPTLSEVVKRAAKAT